MVRMNPERILLIADAQRQVHSALAQAMPAAQVTTVGSYFDAIAELSSNRFTAVLAPAEPIERRPEPAIRTLRELAGDARLVLFGHPTLEPLSRKMLDFGCDDYFVTPANPSELHQLFGSPLMRIAESAPVAATADHDEALPPHPTDDPWNRLPLADIFLDALSENPHDAPTAAVNRINENLPPSLHLAYLKTAAAVPNSPEGKIAVTHAVRADGNEVGQLHLELPAGDDPSPVRHFLSRLSELIAKLQGLQDRHNRLQKLAITDELTGLYNCRYFRHFLSRILDRAREKLFPVTLLIFDIDNFKKYNDQFGHAVGDEILKQTASLIKKCCREHDLVARLGGDEFAVVFWEKEGPRQPKDPAPKPGFPLRPPQTPDQVLERFKRQLDTQEWSMLGPAGRGVLTISGGVAVFPYHAQSMEELIQLADRRLMFGAKKAGKNSIFLIGSENLELPGAEPSI
jgi:PleD family two-component response regulator